MPPPPPPPFCKQRLCPSNAYVHATPGVGSAIFCTVDLGGVLFNLFCCVPCVLPDTLGLRCTKFILCVKAALLAKRAFVVCFASWFSEWDFMTTRVSRKLRRPCPGNTRRWFRQFLVIYRCLDKGVGGLLIQVRLTPMRYNGLHWRSLYGFHVAYRCTPPSAP